MVAYASRAVTVVILLLLLILGVGFYIVGPRTTQEVQAAYESASQGTEPLFKEGELEPTIGEGPFHMAIRYGVGTMQQLVAESVAKKMENGPPAGDMGDKVTVSPLTVTKVDVGFPEGGDGIMKTTVSLAGTLSVDAMGGSRLAARRGGGSSPRTYKIYPRATVKVKMEGQLVDGRPALVINILSLDGFDLNVQDAPSIVMKLSGKILPKIRKKVEAQILTGDDAQRVMSLPEKLGKGDLPVKLVGAGLTIVSGEDGEMFLGMLTNLNVEPQVSADNRGAPLDGADWGLTLGETTLGAMLRAMGDIGKIPTSFNRSGDPDPEGEVRFQIHGAELNPEGFVMKATLWNLALPAFWQDFDIKGKLEMKDGSMAPTIVGMEGGEGGGNTWVGSIIEKQQEKAPKTMATGGSKKLPPQMPLPMSGGTRVLQLNVEDLVMMDGSMTVKGSSEVKDAPKAE